MRRKNVRHVAAYGNVYIPRQFCENCQSYAFVIGGKLACCDSRPSEDTGNSVKRVSDCAIGRHGPSSTWKKRILKAQGDRCFYCYRWFGKSVYRNGKSVTLRCNWDHVSPYVYGLDNRDQNFVAACHVCNGIKSSKIFNSADEPRSYLYEAWAG